MGEGGRASGRYCADECAVRGERREADTGMVGGASVCLGIRLKVSKFQAHRVARIRGQTVVVYSSCIRGMLVV